MTAFLLGRAVNRAVILLAAALLLLPGCAEPFRVKVDPSVLKGSITWRVTERPTETRGIFGPNSVTTEYQHDGSSPPFAGYVVVISQRQAGGYTRDELVAESRRLLAAAADNNLTIDASLEQEGDRTLRSGVSTHWISQEGDVTRSALFAQNARVRLIAEAGFDGLSGTAFVAIARVQVESATQCPVLVSCGANADTRTWGAVVADPQGSVDDCAECRGNNGLLYSLVTHG